MPISPLGQRQIFQIANAEAARAASEMGGQFQREVSAQKAANDRQAEEMESIRKTFESDKLKLQDQKKDQKQNPNEHKSSEESPMGAAGTTESLDLLA